MNLFDPHITGSLTVSASAEIEGDLTVLGTIYGTASIQGQVDNAISASHAAQYLLTSSFEAYTGSASDRLDSIETITGSHDLRLDSLELNSGSQGDRLDSIESFTGSINDTYATDTDVTNLRNDLNTYTSSNDDTNTTQNSRLDSIETTTGSFDGRLDSLETESGSVRSDFNTYTASNDSTNTTQNSRLDSIETTTGSFDGRLDTIETSTSSLNSYTSSNDVRVDNLESTASNHETRVGDLETFETTVNTGLEFTGSNVTIKGNFLVKGTQTTVDSTTVDIGDNIISLNGSAAASAGIEVQDATSPGLLSGSFLWDSTNNYWIGGTKGNEERLLDNSDLTTLDGRLDSLETESGSVRSDLNTYTSSNDNTNTTQNSRLNSLETESGSVRSDFNSYTSSNDSTNSTQNGRLDSLETKTGSLDGDISTLDGRVDSIETFTASIDNTYATDTDVTNLTNTLNTYTSSNNDRVDSLETESGSIRTDFNTYTSSNDDTNTTQNGRLGSLETKTGSLDGDISTLDGRVDSLETESGSIRTTLNSYTSSNDSTNTTQNGRLDSLETKTGSLDGDITTIDGRLDSLETESGSIRTDFNTITSSFDGRLDSLETESGSVRSEFNTYTSSNDDTNTTQNSRLDSIETITGSFDGRLDSLEIESGSVRSDFNSYTSSNDSTNTTQNGRLGSLETKTGSLDGDISTLDGRVDSLEIESGSIRTDFNSYTSSNDTTNTTQNGRLDSLETISGSHDSRLDSLETESGSVRSDFNTYTSSNDDTNTTQNSRLNSLEIKTGSLDGDITTIDGRLDTIETSTGSLNSYTSSLDEAIELTGSNLTVKGNFLVKGTQTTVNSTTVDIGDNIISLNGSAATFAGIEVQDATAPDLLSGSLLWDATNNYWIAGPKGSEVRILDTDDLTTVNGRLGNLETESGSIRTDFNSYTSSNDSTNTTQNSRLDSLEGDTGSYTTTDYFVTGATFDTGSGIITLTRNDSNDVTVDIDGAYVDLFTNQYTIAGEKTFTGAQIRIPNRLGVGTEVYGSTRLGDNKFQTPSIDTQLIVFKGASQTTPLTMFVNNDVTTFKTYTNSINVLSIAGLSENPTGSTREVEATIGLRNDYSDGSYNVFDLFNQDYAASSSDVAQKQGFVAINGGGASEKGIGLWRYDGTTHTNIYEIAATTNLFTINTDVTITGSTTLQSGLVVTGVTSVVGNLVSTATITGNTIYAPTVTGTTVSGGTFYSASGLTVYGGGMDVTGNTILSGHIQQTSDTRLKILSVTNASPIGILFSDNVGGYAQQGYIDFTHSDTLSYGSGASFKISSTETTTTILADGKLMYGEGIYSKPATGTGAGTRKDTNWDTAYSYSQISHLPLSGGTLTGSLTGTTLILTSTTDASLTSTGHAFQIGSTTSTNIIMDNNEIMARNNGAVSGLNLNPDGGDVTIHNNLISGSFISKPVSKFYHGSTFYYTEFGHTNEINTFNSTGGTTSMYLQYRSGLTNIGNGKLIVDPAGTYRVRGLGDTRWDSNSTSDPDAVSTTNYPAAHTFTYYSELNGMAIIGGQGSHTGTTLMLGQETASSSAYNYIECIGDTNGTPVLNFLVRGDGYMSSTGGAGIGGDLTISGNMYMAGSTLQFANNDGFVYDDVNNIMNVRYDGTQYAIISAANIGSQSVSYATSAASATDADRLLRSDNRTISPSEYGSGRMNFGFTSFANNNTSPWADFIHMRGYTDSSGGNDNMLVFSKSGFAMRLYQQTYGSTTAYVDYRRIAMSRATSFSSVTSLTYNHGLGTEDLTAQVFDSSGNLFFPSNLQITSTQVIVTFASARSGRLVVTG